MKRCKLALIASLTLFSSLTLSAQVPSDKDPQGDAEKRLRDLKNKLRADGKSNDVIESLTTLKAIADELHHMQPIIRDMLWHRDPAVRRRAVFAIHSLGIRWDTAPETVASLARSLKDPDFEVRALILGTLSKMGQHSAPVLPQAVEAAKDTEPRVRRAAISLIGSHLSSHRELIPVVISALDDPDVGPDKEAPGVESVSYVAMRYLRACKPPAKESEPKLVAIINATQDDNAIRWMALLTLAAVAPENTVPLKIAREWLTHKERPPDLIKGLTLLWTRGEHAKDAVKDLIVVIKMELPQKPDDTAVKHAVLQALWAIGPAAREAVPTLEDLANTNDVGLRSDIQRTIKVIQGK